MGLLDQILGGVGMGGQPNLRRPGLGGTVAAGLVLALLVKGVRSYEASHASAGEGRSLDPRATPASDPPDSMRGSPGGILGGLGGLLGGGAGGGLGGLLASLGGAGALSALINQFQRKGYGPQVNSWVDRGANQPLEAHQVEDALGDETLQTLEQHTGLSRQSLLADLTHVLPQALDEVTPDGRLPTDQELQQLASQPAPPPR